MDAYQLLHMAELHEVSCCFSTDNIQRPQARDGHSQQIFAINAVSKYLTHVKLDNSQSIIYATCVLLRSHRAPTTESKKQVVSRPLFSYHTSNQCCCRESVCLGIPNIAKTLRFNGSYK